MKNWVDVVFILVSVVSFFLGYKAGFLTTIFSFIGYVGGGFLGLALGLHYFHAHGLMRFLELLLVATIASTIGEAIFKLIGTLFHSKVLFGPFKWIDSLLGSAFAILRAAIGVFILCHLLLITPWGWAHRNIPQSEIYTRLNAQAPLVILNLTRRAESSIH